MSIKGCYSVANLQKNMIYNPNIDLVNDNVYTKFGLNKCICSQDIEQQELSHDSIARLNCALPITKTISVIR